MKGMKTERQHTVLKFSFILFASGFLWSLDRTTASAAMTTSPAFGECLPIWSMLPFVGILLSIAFFPLMYPHVWHRHFGKISAFWALTFAIPFLALYQGAAVGEILHILLIDYTPFIILLGGLFVISAGIVIRGTLSGTPMLNTGLLLIGSLLASLIGTTGASMVMIRPVLRANQNRIRKAHIICFFIFLVANIGGTLTPLGDPPLFLGYLHHIPFFWVTRNLFPHFLLTTGVLLTLFYVIDMYFFRQEAAPAADTQGEKTPLHIKGMHNGIILTGIIVIILMSGFLRLGEIDILGIPVTFQNLLRDAGIVVLALVSLKTTSKTLREENAFSWTPIMEVAKLFAGIFITMIPVIAILKAGGAGALGNIVNAVQSPNTYFWATGMLSAFLDNAPTYLAFFNMALAKTGLSNGQISATLCGGAAQAQAGFSGLLKAISIGAVFMGAFSYLGNAPNFMVKSIAEEAGVNMPSFFGYILKYAVPILLPLFAIVAFVFF